MMRINKTTAAWMVSGALGLSALSGSAFAFAAQPGQAESNSGPAVAASGAPGFTGTEAAPNAFTGPSAVTAAATPTQVTANTPNTPASPATANTPNTPNTPNSPASARTAPSATSSD